MRIDGWQVDGFGILKDVEQSTLEPGVTVFLGENEAGKSTLLAFVRAMLFGFPRANAKGERQYPPVLGGRHGGKLLLRDREEGRWVVSRYADDRKNVSLVRPDGSAGDAAELIALLGGADPQLFKSVFAFGLDELQLIETLTGEGVRERIFSAGISGAGKSAREVIRRLEQQQDELLKQRGGKARINDVVREIQSVGDEEKAALALTGQYEALRQEEREQKDQAQTLRSHVEGLQRRKTEVEAFIELRPQWTSLQELNLEVAGLPAVEDAELPDRVAGLVKELEGQRGREERLPELAATQSAESTAFNDALSRLGEGWTIERISAFDVSVAVHDEVRGWQGKLDDAGDTLRSAQQQHAAAASIANSHAAQLQVVCAELPSEEPAIASHIDEWESQLVRLRDDCGRLDALKLMAESEAMRSHGSRAWLAFVLAGAAVAGAAVSLVAGHPQVGIGLAVAAILVAVMGIVMRGQAPGKPGDQASPSVVAELTAQIGNSARTLGLSERPTSAEMASLEARLKGQRSLRADWNSIQGRVNDAERQANEARRVAGEAETLESSTQAALDAVTSEWAAWLGEHGLQGLSPEGVRDVLGEVKAANDANGRLGTASASIKAIEDQAATWDTSAKDVLKVVGRPASGLSAEALRSAVETLNADLARRAGLIDQIDALERAISVRLASAKDAGGAMDELAAGDAGVWADEASSLDDDIERLSGERDDAVRAAATAGVELKRIEESADIPRLQEERESLRAELAELAHSYRVISAAKGLMSETLKTYVHDRQPAVLASGSEAFATVTHGRYVRVEQDDASALETVAVVNRDGVRLLPDVLSKGTQQQLYLSIRLALVAEFAKRTEPLPLIMDDCLVNFDPKRAEAVAGLLVSRSADGQCLLFTCHPETAELMERQTGGPVNVVEMRVV